MQPQSNFKIRFGKLSWHNLYPFAGSLITVIRYYIFYILKETPEYNIGDFKWEYHPFFFTLLMFIGEAMNGFFYLSSLFLSRQKNQSNNVTTTLVPFKAVNTYLKFKRQLLQKVLLTMLSSYIDGISWCLITFIMSSYDSTKYLSFEMRIFSLFFTALLSRYFLLYYRIFRHQVFSIILVAIGITVFSITDIIQSQFNVALALEYIALYFVASIREVLQKWLLEVKRIQSVKLIFFEGVIGSVTTFIFLIVLRQFFIKDSADFFQEDIFRTFKHVADTVEISWLVAGFFLSSIFINLFSILTKSYFTPTLMAVADSFTMICWTLLLNILGGDSESNWDWSVGVGIVGYAIVFFGCIIYNEIIILYFCDLEKYCRIEIKDRGDNEMNISDGNIIMAELISGQSDKE